MPPTPRIIRRHSSAPHLGEEEEANTHRNFDLIAAESKPLKVMNHHANAMHISIHKVNLFRIEIKGNLLTQELSKE